MFNQLYNWLRYRDRGASMVEYALLVVLIAIAGLVAVSWFGETLGGTYETIASEMADANP
jgi:Flp pilus assembly pilin Flp